MAKVKHFIGSVEEVLLNDIIDAGLVAFIKDEDLIIVGRHGTNKNELKKILKKYKVEQSSGNV